MTRNSSF